jgi:c-di-GMP-binding flagellar brake protein YcgR
MPERRRENRSSIDLLVNKYIDGDPHLCRAINLSRRGMLLFKIFEPDLPLGEVTIEFQLPGDDRVIRASGMTLAEHLRARAHGVRFTRIDPAHAHLIDAFVAGLQRASAFG